MTSRSTPEGSELVKVDCRKNDIDNPTPNNGLLSYYTGSNGHGENVDCSRRLVSESYK